MVEPPRTHSNLPCRPASLLITAVGGGRCGRTSSNSLEPSCRPASLFITAVGGGSVWSNFLELTRTCPVGLLLCL